MSDRGKGCIFALAFSLAMWALVIFAIYRDVKGAGF